MTKSIYPRPADAHKTRPVGPKFTSYGTIYPAQLAEDKEYADELRHRFETDHFFAAEILGYDKFIPELHQPAVDLYFGKNKNLKIEDQDAVKYRMHLDPRHTFKALDIKTPIPTPQGFKFMADIQIGDVVYSDDGKPCNVTAVSPVFKNRPCLQVSFSSGEKIVCDEDHLWLTDARRDRDAHRNGRYKQKYLPCPTVKTTRTILDTLYCRKELNHRVHLTKPIAGVYKRFAVSPYVVGAWLGDGTMGSSGITLPVENKQEVFAQIGEEGEHIWRNDYTSAPGHCHVEMLWPRLRKYSAIAKRLIPEEYLLASFRQRLSLLQGLMDTDGSASATNGDALFSTSNYALALQVKSLVCSLGFKPYMVNFEAKIGEKSYGTAYRVGFAASCDGLPVFRVPSKLAKLTSTSKKKASRYRRIVAVRRVKSRPVKCITVDSPSELFLATDSFIPTHNSTLGKVDAAQWVAAFPDLITILFESATQPLAEALSLNIGRFFWQKPGERPTVLQAMYPHIVTSARPDAKWDTPTHAITEMDHTLDFTSPKTTQSGWHPYVICPDDMVDGVNSGIHAEAKPRQAVIDTYYVNKNLLRHGGYICIRGTRYHPFDLYGDLIGQIEKNPDSWKVLIRGSLIVKSGEPLMPGVFPDEDDVILVFPQLLPYKILREKFFENYEAFMTQQMNDPKGGSISTFGEKLYGTILIEQERIPPMGDTFVCWRLPYGGKDYMAKYAEGAAARIWNGRVYVLDAWQGIYTPSGLAEKIVRENKHYETHQLLLEAIPGTEYMETHIKNEAIKRNVSLRFTWYEFEEDDNVRQARLRLLEPQMQAGRILISMAVSKASEIRRQFVHFGLVEENGIVDCISRLAARLPVSQLRQEISEEELALQEKRRQDAMFRMVFGQPGATATLEQLEQERQAKMATLQALTRTNEYGLPYLYGLDG